jgi:DNA-binding NarL/FixJ family response regulator
MKKPGIILVDDHRLFRCGLKYMLEESGKYQVIAESSDAPELLELLKVLKPDLVIMEIKMPVVNGMEIVRKILVQYPRLNILLLSMYGEPEYYSALLDLGIKGFMLKDADSEELFLVINKILTGGTYFSQELLLNIIRKNSMPQPVKLSQREKEILIFIGQGLSNQEISVKLSISPRTVERHRTNLLDKTGSKNSVRLIVYALKNNLITFEDAEIRR